MSIQCFWLKRTGRQKLYLRRYVSGADCGASAGYHQAIVLAAEAPEILSADGCIESVALQDYEGDPRWPTLCGACGYRFTEGDTRQVFTESIYERTDTGEKLTLSKAPAGAMWNAWHLNDMPQYSGPDRLSIVVRLPGGHDWIIDSRASNCDSLCERCGHPWHQHYKGGRTWTEKYCPQGYVDARPHKCWIRHGTPPNLTVDKNGVTCGAGAGSIVVEGWHGFLRDGHLVPC